MNKKEKLKITKVASAESAEMEELMTILEEAFATAMLDYPKDGDEMPVPSGKDLMDMMVEGKDVLGTPYFLKRNIHFYINKCGFKITKYYNKWNPFISEDKTEDGDFFWFEKEM